MATIESALLGLPMEMVQRTTDNTTPEALLQVCPTCKTLDSATLDRFAHEHYGLDFCCIYDRTRWQRLSEILSSSRPGPRVKRVCLTVRYCEQHDYRDIATACPSLDTALNQSQWMALKAARREIRTSPLPDHEFILSVIKQLAQVAMPLDLRLAIPDIWPGWRDKSKNEDGPGEKEVPRFDSVDNTMLAYIFKEGACLDQIDVDHSTTRAIYKQINNVGNDLPSVAKNITMLLLADRAREDGYHTVAVSTIERLLGAIPKLRLFSLSMACYETPGPSNLPSSSSLLLANDFAHLTHLQLYGIITEEEPLLKALRRCASNLSRLGFKEVYILSEDDNVWLAVMRMINGMPKIGCF
jgi:hypothetical protein